MTLSEELSAAAALIRETAAKASDSPWRFERNELVDGGVVANDAYEVAHPGMDEDGPHIALWEPDIAELVARVLDEADAAIGAASRQGIAGLTSTLRGALADLARAINAKGGAV